MVEHLLAKERVAGSSPVSRFSYALIVETLLGHFCICIFYFLYSLGVMPYLALKARLKYDTLLYPHSNAICIIE